MPIATEQFQIAAGLSDVIWTYVCDVSPSAVVQTLGFRIVSDGNVVTVGRRQLLLDGAGLVMRCVPTFSHLSCLISMAV